MDKKVGLVNETIALVLVDTMNLNTKGLPS